MAMTTTAVNGCDAIIMLDNAAGTPVDISGSSNSVEIQFDNDMGEYKTFGSKWKARLECGKDASFKLKIVYTTAAAEAMRNLLNWYFITFGGKTLTVDIPSSGAGGDRYSAEVKLETFSIPAPSDEPKPILVEMTLLPDGAVAWTQL